MLLIRQYHWRSWDWHSSLTCLVILLLVSSSISVEPLPYPRVVQLSCCEIGEFCMLPHVAWRFHPVGLRPWFAVYSINASVLIVVLLLPGRYYFLHVVFVIAVNVNKWWSWSMVDGRWSMEEDRVIMDDGRSINWWLSDIGWIDRWRIWRVNGEGGGRTYEGRTMMRRVEHRIRPNSTLFFGGKLEHRIRLFRRTFFGRRGT